MRHKRDIEIALKIFGKPPHYYHCPHFDKKGRMLAFCICPVLPYYFNTIYAAWKVHCEMKYSPECRAYARALQRVVTERMRKYADPPHGVMLSWPDVILLLEPRDICNAALEVAVQNETA